MPVLRVRESKDVIVLERTMATGYAGTEPTVLPRQLGGASPRLREGHLGGDQDEDDDTVGP